MRTNCKEFAAVSSEDLCVGLDVHARSVSVGVWKGGKIVKCWRGPSEVETVCRELEPYRKGMKSVVYEAGPTGFKLARRLAKAGLPMAVVAPSKILRATGAETKTDKIDCRKLAEHAAKGMLKAIAIPTEEEEANRQVIRLRSQFVEKGRQAKLRIKSFLLQHGIDVPGGKGCWSRKYIELLKGLKLSGELRFVLDLLIRELEETTQSLATVGMKLDTICAKEDLARKVEILKTHPGVGKIIAQTFCLEMFRPDRFTRGPEIVKYLGLAPKISQSGDKIIRGRTMKTGQRILRSMMIEACWLWVQRDGYGRKCYQHYLQKSGKGPKAIVAMARKMALNLWAMLRKNQEYREPT